MTQRGQGTSSRCGRVESPRVSRVDVRPPRRPDAVPKDAVKQIFLEDSDEYSTLAVAQVGAFLDVGATFSHEEDLLPSAQKLLKAMRRERPREDRKKPLEPPFSSLDVDLEDVRRWHSREAILREDAWVSSHAPSTKAAASVYEAPLPPPPSPSREITTFAWDEQGSTVKLYLSFGQFVEELVSSDVAVRFSSGSVRVRVGDLTFERKLFAPVKPSKCGFKVNEERRVVVVSLRKKRKEEAWPAFAADVNADPSSGSA